VLTGAAALLLPLLEQAAAVSASAVPTAAAAAIRTDLLRVVSKVSLHYGQGRSRPGVCLTGDSCDGGHAADETCWGLTGQRELGRYHRPTTRRESQPKRTKTVMPSRLAVSTFAQSWAPSVSDV
jgi:hypothetical protein